MIQNLESMLAPALEIARSAGTAIMEVYGSDFDVEHKADESPITAADNASHAIIIEGLGALTPSVPLLSEESGLPSFDERSGWKEYWLIDPLDGTKEFIKRNGEFTVNIALIQNHEPVLGVVTVPARDQAFYGCRGAGAFRQDDGDPARPIRVSRLGDEAVRVVGSRSHASPALAGYLEKLGRHQMVPMGSSLKFCLVAEGSADIYPRLGPTSEWDTAAAQAVVECAGGRVTDTSGAALRYNAKEDILNPHFLVFGDASRDWAALL